MAKRELDPGIRQFATWLAEDRTLGEVDPILEKDAERLRASARRIADARPTDPAVMAAQMRWIISGNVDAYHHPALEHIAGQLEALAAPRIF